MATVMFSLVLLLFSLGLAAGGPVAVSDYQMHPLTDFTWRGNVTAGGPIVEYSGNSFKQIEAKIAMNVTGFTWKGTWHEQHLNMTDGDTGMVKDIGTPQCRITGGHRPCNHVDINEGCNYLEAKAGECGLEGKSCSRISCSWDSAIYFCNDNAVKIWIGCRNLGNNARYINQQCTAVEGMGANGVAGQIFNSDGWNNFVGATTAEERGC